MKSSFTARIEQLRQQIGQAATAAGRNPEEITLIGVSKRHGVALCDTAINHGIKHLGENYVQEWKEKAHALEKYSDNLKWHFIGGLQSNKVNPLVSSDVLIHTVDRISLAKALGKAATRQGKIQEVLVQVNEAREPQKGGVFPEAFDELIECIGSMDSLRLRGLMCIPPASDSPEQLRKRFQSLRKRLEYVQSLGHKFADAKELSMGMSKDFAIAIEEGATMIRVGTALFGPRSLG